MIAFPSSGGRYRAQRQPRTNPPAAIVPTTSSTSSIAYITRASWQSGGGLSNSYYSAPSLPPPRPPAPAPAPTSHLPPPQPSGLRPSPSPSPSPQPSKPPPPRPVRLPRLPGLAGAATAATAATTAAARDQRQWQWQQQPQRHPASRLPPTNPTVPKLQAGKMGTFLAQTAPNLSDEILIGKMPSQLIETDCFTKLKAVSDFLSQYRAMATLDQIKTSNSSNSSSSNSSSSSNININAAFSSYYVPTITHFAKLQMDRQAAGLRTNTNGQTSEAAKDVVESHARAMQAALTGNDDEGLKLSKKLLCEWHGIMMPKHQRQQSSSPSNNGATNDNQHDTPSNYRTHHVRAGKTYFCSAAQIEQTMDSLFDGWQELYDSRWIDQLRVPINTVNTTTTLCSVQTLYHGIAMAAILLAAICDIHPFADGNGRLSRICANWVLSRLLGLPFTITIVATPQHRQLYVDALRHAHITILKQQQSSATNNAANNINRQQSSSSIFYPLMKVLLDRIVDATQEVQRLLKEKSELATTEEEAQIARKVRERNAAGACIICLDDHPNIATLCCGQAVHLNCIAEWLTNNGASCVNCRKPLPPMTIPPAPARPPSPPPAPAQQQPAGPVANSSTNNHTVAAAAVAALHMYYNYNNNDNNSTNDYYDAAVAAMSSARAAVASFDDGGGGGVAQSEEAWTTTTTTTTITEEDYTTTTTAAVYYDDAQQQQEEQIWCEYCNNQAAIDCENGLCGRCCVIHGQLHCARHYGY